MNEQTPRPSRQAVRVRPSGGRMAFLLGIGSVLYILLAVGCAGYLLWKAYTLPANAPQPDFDKLAIAALIAVVGTGLTGLASVYSATRQSATAYQVAEYNGVISTKLTEMKSSSDDTLARMKADIDASLAQFKAASDESLARLKIALDAGQIAYRELFGAATVYFHALRSTARVRWEDESLKVAEAGMISAARQTINVSTNMRDEWLAFWQRAQEIYREANAEPDADKRPPLVAKLIDEKVKFGTRRLDFRDIHEQLECTARLGMDTSAGAGPVLVAGQGRTETPQATR